MLAKAKYAKCYAYNILNNKMPKMILCNIFFFFLHITSFQGPEQSHITCMCTSKISHQFNVALKWLLLTYLSCIFTTL